jgi:putative tryptophan/tyrosine transport system substrate-binding protein
VIEYVSRRVPSIYGWREAGTVGGLMNSGTNWSWRQAGVYTGSILKDEKPSDLQPTSFKLNGDVRCASALGG